MPDLAGLLCSWRDDLAAWAIPEHITAAVAESPGCCRARCSPAGPTG